MTLPLQETDAAIPLTLMTSAFASCLQRPVSRLAIQGIPKGRPEGAKSKRPALNDKRLKTIVIEEAYRTVKVRDVERNLTILMAQTVVRTLALSAVKGSNRAAQIFTRIIQTVETEINNCTRAGSARRSITNWKPSSVHQQMFHQG